MIKAGRNESCPCGSGKKYKKCCLDSDQKLYREQKARHPVLPDPELGQLDERNHFVSAAEIGDHGEAILSEEFFRDNPLAGMSAAFIVHQKLVHPEFDDMAAEIAGKFISRHHAEALEIESAKTLSQLIDFMKRGVDPLNQRLLIERISEYADQAVQSILSELPANQNIDEFVETAVKVIYESKVDYSGQLLLLLEGPIENAYTRSLLCMLAGLIGSEAAVKPLWDHYHFFKERIPEESYREGPLLGLLELALRFGKIAAWSVDSGEEQSADAQLKLVEGSAAS